MSPPALENEKCRLYLHLFRGRGIAAATIVTTRRQSSLADLTSREAVLAAMAEYDALGQDRFLAQYGFRLARGYRLYMRQQDARVLLAHIQPIASRQAEAVLCQKAVLPEGIVLRHRREHRFTRGQVGKGRLSASGDDRRGRNPSSPE